MWRKGFQPVYSLKVRETTSKNGTNLWKFNEPSLVWYFDNKKSHVTIKPAGSCSSTICLKARIFICTGKFDFSPSLHLKNGAYYFYSLVNKYGLLTKCQIKMAGYWPSRFFACLNSQTKTRPISSHLDRTNLVNKGYKKRLLEKFRFAGYSV